MKAKFFKKAIAAVALASALISPIESVIAAEGISLTSAIKEVNTEINANALTEALVEVKKETAVAPTLAIKSTEEMQFELLFDGVALANTEEYLFVYPTAEESLEWNGKVYNLSKVEVIKTEGEWSEIKSRNVTGFVKTENLLTGRDAIDAAKAFLTELYPEKDIFTLTKSEVFGNFKAGETKQEEKIRIAAETAARIAAEKAAEEARIAAEKAAKLEKGKEVISYAKQFLGNPYVYGGTSLTNGTDCSGFVKSVYQHFGVGLPRTSGSMRSVGEKISYDDMQPGDIVCYSGHVALYMGDGKIVHAANARDDITISSVNYARIITIRRVL